MSSKLSIAIFGLSFITIFHFVFPEPTSLTIKNLDNFTNLFNFLLHPLKSIDFFWIKENFGFLYGQYVDKLMHPLNPEAQVLFVTIIMSYFITFVFHIVVWIKILNFFLNEKIKTNNMTYVKTQKDHN
jgi:hypothetical protein